MFSTIPLQSFWTQSDFVILLSKYVSAQVDTRLSTN